MSWCKARHVFDSDAIAGKQQQKHENVRVLFEIFISGVCLDWHAAAPFRFTAAPGSCPILASFPGRSLVGFAAHCSMSTKAQQ